MDFRLSEELESLPRKFIHWLEPTTAELKGSYGDSFFDSMEIREKSAGELQRRLFDAGYAGRYWPVEYGGQVRPLEEGLDGLRNHRYVSSRVPLPVFCYARACGANCSCGSEEQKRAFLPRMLDETHLFCQGLSELQAGWDIFNVTSRAESNEFTCGDPYWHREELVRLVTGEKAPGPLWTNTNGQ